MILNNIKLVWFVSKRIRVESHQMLQKMLQDLSERSQDIRRAMDARQ